MTPIKKKLTGRIEKIWYNDKPLSWINVIFLTLLKVCSSVYKAVFALQKNLQLSSPLSRSFHPKIPVIVVGNLTVGGTGKTPLVIALAEYLKQGGYRPGIVSRGYGGRAKKYPLQVSPQTSPVEAGDEAVLLAGRTQCPVVVAPKRVDAIRFLLAHSDCNIILSDDGLQHWPMKRDIEILVIDGKRRFGNGQCLPAGPLRESDRRCQFVDFVVTNDANEKRKGEYPFKVIPECFVNMGTGEHYPLDFFSQQKINVITAIGHPERFLNTLKKLNIMNATIRILPDHYLFTEKDLLFEQDNPVVMTEKDAVKCKKFGGIVAKNPLYYLRVVPELDVEFKEAFMKKLNQVVLRLTNAMDAEEEQL